MLAQFILTLREGLEAALVTVIVAAYLRKIERNDLSRYLWLGSGLAVLARAVLSVVFWTLYGMAGVPVREDDYLGNGPAPPFFLPCISLC